MTGVAEPSSGEVTWVVDAALAEDAEHSWRVSASDAYVQGPWSEVFAFIPDVIGDAPTTPAPLSPLSGEVVAIGDEQLIWADSTSPEDLAITYVVDLFDGMGDLVISEDVANDATEPDTTWDIPVALEVNRPYSWQVSAFDSVGRLSAASEEQFFGFETTNQPPDAPEFLSPTLGEQLVDLGGAVVVTEPSDPDGGVVTLRLEIDSVETFDSADLLVLELAADDGGTYDLDAAGFAYREHTAWFLRATSTDVEGLPCFAAPVIEVFARGANDPPNVPELLSPASDVGIEPRPTFTVRSATDPEGDAITYQFRLSTDEQGTEVVASGSVAATDWTPDDEIVDSVFWTARATDSKGASSGWATPRQVIPTSVNGQGCQSSVADGGASWMWLVLLGAPLLRRRR